MPDANDMELVREFARDHSEAAFTELVRRHLNLVYSIARRCTGSDGDAEDVTQAVFVILARKAAGLRDRTVLPGWLAETTRYTAACVQRGHARRHAREQEAYMQSTLTATDTAEAWARLAPHLEAGMAQLGDRDRTLLTLRFYENKSGPEAAVLLGIQEAAAHKRTARALEKLRKFFTRRGVALSTAAIAGAVSANSVQAAPAGMAVKISVIAAQGAATTTAITTLVKGTMNLMSWAKAKMFALTGTGLLITATAIVIFDPSIFIAGKNDYSLSFQASGFCNYTNYDVSEKPKGVINSTFTAAVEGRKVYIRLDYAKDNHEEWSYDGTNSYLLQDTPDQVNTFPGAKAAANLRETEFPKDAAEFERVIWLALCSTHYFATSTNDHLLVPWGAWGMGGLFSFDWHMDRLSDPPFLPKKIEFVASTARWEKEKQVEPPSDLKQFPFQDGFIGGKFEVASILKWNDLTIPEKFVVERYRANGSKPNQLLQTCSLVVTNFGVCTVSSFRPKITRPTDVSDMRNESVQMPRFGITYTLTNDNWPDKKDPKRISIIEKEKPVYWEWRRLTDPKHNLYRALKIGLFGLITVSFLFACLGYFRHQRR